MRAFTLTTVLKLKFEKTGWFSEGCLFIYSFMLASYSLAAGSAMFLGKQCHMTTCYIIYVGTAIGMTFKHHKAIYKAPPN